MNINEIIINAIKEYYNVKDEVVLKTINENKFNELKKESTQKPFKFSILNEEYETLLIIDVSSKKYIAYIREKE